MRIHLLIMAAVMCGRVVAADAGSAVAPSIAASGTPSVASASVTAHPAWEAFLKNPDELAADASSMLRVLHAQYAGDDAAEYAAWKNLFEDVCETPEAVFALDFLESSSSQCDAQADLMAFYEKAYASSRTHPRVKTALVTKMVRKALWLHDLKKLERYIGKDGVIPLWARVAGSFASPYSDSMNHRTEMEIKPSAESYVDERGRKVLMATNVMADREGWLSLSRALEGDSNGPVYAQALLETDLPRDIILSIDPIGESRIWVNGLLVYHEDIYALPDGYRRSTHERVVRFGKGVNHIMVKADLYDDIEIRLLDPDGSAAEGIVACRWESLEKSLTSCRPSPGMVYSRPAVSVWDVSSNPEMVKTVDWAQRGEWGAWTCLVLESGAGVQQARAAWDALLEAYPESYVACMENARFRTRESQWGVDSDERLEKEALALLRRAHDLSPEHPVVNMRLAEYYDNRDQPDQALPFFRTAFEHRGKNLEAVLALSYHESQRGWTELAFSRLKGCPSLRMVEYQRMALLRSLGRTVEAEEIDVRLDMVGEYGWHSQLARARDLKDWDACQDIATRYLQFYPEGATTVEDWNIQIAVVRGQLEEACRLLEAKAARRPESDSYSWQRIADLRMEMGDTKASTSALETAIRISMERTGSVSETLVRRLRDRQQGKWINPEFDVALADVAAEDFTAARFPSADFAQILNVEVYRIFPDRSVETLRHIAMRPFTADGIDQLGETSLPSDLDNLFLCHTILPDGSVFVPTNMSRLSHANAASMYRVTPGCTLEYAWREYESGGWDNTFYKQMSFQEVQVPIACARLVVIVPKSMVNEINARVRPSAFPPEVIERADEMVYIWERRNVAPVVPEPGMPSQDEVLENVSLSMQAPSYGWSYLFDRDRPEPETGPAFAALAASIVGDATDAGEKLRRIHAWMRANLKPMEGTNTARDVFAMRGYDDSSAQRFLRAMLAAVNVPTYQAFPNASLMPHTADPVSRGSRAAYFGGSLLMIPDGDGKEIWFQWQSPLRNHLPRDMNAGLVNAPALVRGKMGVLTSTRVDGLHTGELPVTIDLHVALQADGSGVVTGKLVLVGSQAAALRQVTENTQQRRRIIERMPLMFFPGLRLEESIFPEQPVVDAAVDAEPFVYTFRGVLAHAASLGKKRMSWKVFSFPMQVLQMLLAPEDRSFDFVVGQDVAAQQQISVTLPEGWSFRDVPDSAFWRSAHGFFMMHVAAEGRELTASRSLFVPAARLDPIEYRALSALASACKKTDTVTVTAVPVSKALVPYTSAFWQCSDRSLVDVMRFQDHWLLSDLVAKKGDGVSAVTNVPSAPDVSGVIAGTDMPPATDVADASDKDNAPRAGGTDEAVPVEDRDVEDGE